MIEIKNEELFGKVIATALASVERNDVLTSGMRLRWINAIGKAVAKLEERAEAIEWMPAEGHLLIWSDSNKIYEANGTCQCEAFAVGQPCWHRAAAKLIKNYLAAENNPPQTKAAGAAVAMENAPYLKPERNYKPQMLGGVRF